VTTATPVRHEWTPNDRQREVLEAIRATPEGEYWFIGYGGAAGGAKTNLLAEGAIEFALQCPGSRQLVGRHTMKDLRTTTLQEFDERCPREILHKSYDSGPVYRQIRDPHWPEGVVSTIYFREVKDAKNGIGSEQFGAIWLEEAHEIDKADILYLFSRLRHKPERKWGIVCAFNPFPSYVVDVFLEGTETFEVEEGAETVVHQTYVPARVADNPHLPANYGAMMRQQYSNDPFMLAVLLEGRSGVVPNAIFPQMKDPSYIQILRMNGFPAEWLYTATGDGVDWGTSHQHQSAQVIASREKSGIIAVRDAWMSPEGSSDELYEVGSEFKSHYGVQFAAFDRSQGSLEDDLKIKSPTYRAQYPNATAGLFPDVRKGIRDVDGRIRVYRGLLGSSLIDGKIVSDPRKSRVRFDWSKPGVRMLWNQLAMYHRDDDGDIVEVNDDLVDAFFYVLWELEHWVPLPSMGHAQRVGQPQRPMPVRSAVVKVG
jgi:hypothetical protein